VYGLQIERTKGFVDGLDLAGTKTAIFPGSVGYVKPLGVFGNGIHHAVGLALVVPDFARHEVALDEQSGGYEFHIRERLLEQTLWIVPGWGACFGPRLCAASLCKWATGAPPGCIRSSSRGPLTCCHRGRFDCRAE